jgi:hypothetical protein
MSDDPADLESLSDAEADHLAGLVLVNEQVILDVTKAQHPGLVLPACMGAAATLLVDSLPPEQVEAMVEELCRLLRDRARNRLEMRRAMLGPAAGNA